MSKVPYTINVHEYVCTALEQIRTMVKTLDFSYLPAVVERVQFHASSMEDALYAYRSMFNVLDKLEDEKVSDEEFRKKVRAALSDLRASSPILERKIDNALKDREED